MLKNVIMKNENRKDAKFSPKLGKVGARLPPPTNFDSKMSKIPKIIQFSRLKYPNFSIHSIDDVINDVTARQTMTFSKTRGSKNAFQQRKNIFPEHVHTKKIFPTHHKTRRYRNYAFDHKKYLNNKFSWKMRHLYTKITINILHITDR